MPIGIFADGDYPHEVCDLKPGDRVLLYTDGIVEASDSESSYFDVARVKESLEGSFSKSSQASLVALLSQVEEFSREAPPSDDRTALLISVTP
jgi:sigma-B regulation protein RsbU (phosphoserine phosphatase)